MATLDKAIRIASVAFEGVFDKGGKPYILHCLWVMDRVRHLGVKYMIVAVLHDLLEDCEDWTPNRLREEGFAEDIVETLILLDMRGVDYMTRIKEIKLVALAREPKKRDLEHNSKITRLKDVRDKDFERLKKYNLAHRYLSA